MYVGGGFRGEDMGFFFLGNMAWKARRERRENRRSCGISSRLRRPSSTRNIKRTPKIMQKPSTPPPCPQNKQPPTIPQNQSISSPPRKKTL